MIPKQTGPVEMDTVLLQGGYLAHPHHTYSDQPVLILISCNKLQMIILLREWWKFQLFKNGQERKKPLSND